MKYRALAIKWRPLKFGQIIGHINIIQLLKQSIKCKKLHHVYLFSGPSGVGKTSMARIFAKSINCDMTIKTNPCNICRSCLTTNDIIEIDAASKTKVEETKEILDNMKYIPSISQFKIYIIDEIHMLSKHSFNSLLKALEEPFSHIKFLLATTDHHKIPNTILSRCVILNLKKITDKNIISHLSMIATLENIKCTLTGIKAISSLSNHNIRNSLNLLEQCSLYKQECITEKTVYNISGIVQKKYIIKLFYSIVVGEIHQVLNYINYFYIHNYCLENILVQMQNLLHDLLIIKIRLINTHQLILKFKNYSCLLPILSISHIKIYYQIIVDGFQELKYMPDKKLGLEFLLLKMVTINDKNKINDYSVIY